MNGKLCGRQADPAEASKLESAVDVFRALDYRHGGGASRAAVAVLEPFLPAIGAEAGYGVARRRWYTGLADLYNLKGWAEFDTGRWRRAEASFDRAAELAAEAGNQDLV